LKREGKSSGESETTDSKFLTADIRSGSEKRFRVFAGRPLDALPAFAQAFDFPVPPVETRRFSLSPWSSSQPQRSTRFGLGGREAIRPWPCGVDVWCRRRRGGLSSPSCSRACQPGRGNCCRVVFLFHFLLRTAWPDGAARRGGVAELHTGKARALRLRS